MIFTTNTDYALKSLVYMASHKDQKYFSVGEISLGISASKSYLSKVLQKLVDGGFLNSRTGPGKGYSFAKEPASFTFRQIIDLMGDSENLHQCFFGWAECSDSNPCPFHDQFAHFRNKLKTWLEQEDFATAARKGWPAYKDALKA